MSAIVSTCRECVSQVARPEIAAPDPDGKVGRRRLDCVKCGRETKHFLSWFSTTPVASAGSRRVLSGDLAF